MNSFEITQEDIITVLESHNVEFDKNKIEQISELIDDVEVSITALAADYDDGMDDEVILMRQTEAAYDEIANQLYKAGVISEEQISKYGNRTILNQKPKHKTKM